MDFDTVVAVDVMMPPPCCEIDGSDFNLSLNLGYTHCVVGA